MSIAPWDRNRKSRMIYSAEFIERPLPVGLIVLGALLFLGVVIGVLIRWR